MPLTKEQFEKARKAGFSVEKIIEFEKRKNKVNKADSSSYQELDRQRASAPMNIAKETIVGTGSVLRESTGKMLKGISDAVFHPITTADSLGRAFLGMYEKVIPGEQVDEKYFDAIAKTYMDRYGSVDKVADTVAKDPIAFISDVTMLLSGGNIVGKLSKSEKIKKATDISTISQPFKKAYGAINRGIGGSTAKDAIRIINPSSVEDLVFKNYVKAFGIKPKIYSDIKNAKSDVMTKVKAIQENIPSEGLVNPLTGEIIGKLPIDRVGHAVAYENALNRIWEKATILSKGATDKGAKIDFVKATKEALAKTEEGYGKLASETINKEILKAASNASDDIAKIGKASPTQTQTFMKSLFDRAKKDRLDPGIQYKIDDYYRNLYDTLNDHLDNAIESSLSESGYLHYKKQYALLRKDKKAFYSSVENSIKRQHGHGGLDRKVTNFWALEEVLSGALMGGESFISNIKSAGAIKASAALIDYWRSPDFAIKNMYKAIKDVELPREVKVEILTRKIPTPETISLPYLPKENKILKQKLLVNESSGPVIKGENPVKRIGYNPSSDGIHYGPELKGEYHGGFGQFIMKDSPKKIKRKK